MSNTADFQRRLQSIEGLLAAVEASADPNLRADVKELVQLIMDLHGRGLERAIELIRASGDGGEGIVQRLGRDELTSDLLLLYGLHPLDFEARLEQTLEKARLRLRSLQGEVELVGVSDGAVTLRIAAHGHGCGSTPQAIKEVVEEAMYQGVPDLVSLTVQGAEEKAAFVPLQSLVGAAL